ncbi:HAMP domain-containing histidine kinase [Streptomyces sp. WAC05374]|uniref:sensor histidine kinase n=1 Tax=Streptomyces sp. WAC05374 TaxID=2487420 RepID=UPI000F8795EA|nr:HAMP domain-containing sensor histidine kinase [Streptomyces sp. WAC05374]RST19435.1 sensor histidine kinase [Streptomyces sp. WAC05374]TDF48568.1 HAMP domain-containing histidine kinase [Streptomyces sp. WAC05374]TDF54876.1 HAMP domain-containing histidine kinase [Streptomyces sp. WAC05374]TDF55502.1 HAMP domain-containing histidine kinase [Streptomyces sp. WAC05374]
MTTPETTSVTRADRRVSARVRILLWLLLVMAVALVAVAMTTRSILLRDVDHRISQLLTQETREFANFVDQGVDPDTGAEFTAPRRLLEVFLQRQYSDPDEELLGLTRGPGGTPAVLRQPRDTTGAALHRDRGALARIFASPARSGTLHRPQGEVRWAKVPIQPAGRAAPGAFVVAFHAGHEQAIAAEAFRTQLAISGVALLMTTGIGWAVAGRILAPVRLVRRAAAQLTEQDLTRRIPVQGRDDIALLAETFNAMLDRLERAFATQRRFVDDAGHELRTPITIVRGHLELMGDDPAEQAETIRLVTDELDRMSRIVEDLLLLAKAERPDFVTPEPVQLGELTADVFVKARALGEREWVLDSVADREAELDPQRITQAMVQLAQNAVQHTVPGQRIGIGSRESDGRIELYVADTGSGVRAEDAAVIFERFRRGAARRGTRAGGGAGLGLSIVKAIAEGHRGRVELRRTEGGGATFVLVLEEDE